MMARSRSLLLTLVGVGFILFAETQPMAQAAPPMMDTGFSYSPDLAAKFGLPADSSTALTAPLLGAGIEIKDGIVGKVCVLHILYDATIDIRLPDAQSMLALGSNMDMFPNGFMKRPDKRQ